MSRYFDDELIHSGVKGMKWRKHKYRLVKDANGKLRYVYDNDNTGTGMKSSKAQMFRQARAEEKDKVIGKRTTGTKPLTETHLVSTKTTNNGPLQTSKLRSTVLTGRSGERKQREEKQEATRDRKAIERMARNERHRQAEANNHKAKATGKRASWAPDKPYQSKVEYDQAHQSFMLKERDKLRKKGEPSLISSPYNGSASKYHDEAYKDQQRRARKSLEELSPSDHRARAAESTARHKAAVKAQKEQSERRKRLRQAEANKEQIEKRKKAQRVANNYKAKATGKRAKWAYDKPYQSKAEYDQRRQRLTLMDRDKMKEHGGYDTYGSSYFKKHTDGNRPYFSTSTETASQKSKRNYEDEKRWRAREMEGFYNNRANIGQMSRAAESTARHKAAVKAQKKKRITDTIDKGRKAVEEFFTPKKKKKR